MFFGPKACGILTPGGGIELSTPALGSKVFTSGTLEKSPSFLFIDDSYLFHYTDLSKFVYLFISRRTPWLLPVLMVMNKPAISIHMFLCANTFSNQLGKS